MNVLVSCEYSGIVRDAFIAKGHHAVSCDLLNSEAVGSGWHLPQHEQQAPATIY